jgi:hypothetical protein
VSLPSCVAAALALTAPATALAATPHAWFPLGAAHRGGHATGAAPGSMPALLSGVTIPVTTCADDGGFDTLRHAVLVADPGDTVDLSSLACSKITLQSGAIDVSVSDLTIVGPGADKLRIDGNAAGRVFKHGGTGTLALERLTIANGKVVGDAAYGGCIYTLTGKVSLKQSVVTSCAAIGQSKAVGGAILAYTGVYIGDSTLTQNEAHVTAGTSADNFCAGGAVVSPHKLQIVRSVLSGNTAHAMIGKVYGGASFSGELSAKYSTISGNAALGSGDPDNGNYSVAGASVSSSKTQIVSSTIDNNSADADGALLLLDYGTTVSIIQSTISSNVGILGLGVMTSTAAVSISNSTIAFNQSGGLVPVAMQMNAGITLQSTIIADNPPLDIASGPITGSHNLVKTSYDPATLPLDTITLDPKLGPLAANGGATRTHTLAANSPALNTGSNVSGFATDQRGPTYRRVVAAAADIGASELDSDHIFGSAFSDPAK